MAIRQVPADFPIELVQGDELNFALHFNLDLTDYDITTGIFNASVVNPTDYASPTFEMDVVTVPGATESDPDVTTTTLTMSFVETLTQSLAARQAWRWYLRWQSPGGVTRTILSGPITVRTR